MDGDHDSWVNGPPSISPAPTEDRRLTTGGKRIPIQMYYSRPDRGCVELSWTLIYYIHRNGSTRSVLRQSCPAVHLCWNLLIVILFWLSHSVSQCVWLSLGLPACVPDNNNPFTSPNPQIDNNCVPMLNNIEPASISTSLSNCRVNNSMSIHPSIHSSIPQGLCR